MKLRHAFVANSSSMSHCVVRELWFEPEDWGLPRLQDFELDPFDCRRSAEEILAERGEVAGRVRWKQGELGPFEYAYVFASGGCCFGVVLGHETHYWKGDLYDLSRREIARNIASSGERKVWSDLRADRCGSDFDEAFEAATRRLCAHYGIPRERARVKMDIDQDVDLD